MLKGIEDPKPKLMTIAGAANRPQDATTVSPAGTTSKHRISRSKITFNQWRDLAPLQLAESVHAISGSEE